jgi:outer membrane biosynthesis protein TonB
MTETEIWTKWESQVVNGIFPLRRFLGRSNHSVVFLTECRAQNLVNAAIKIIPADPARAESQLSRWQLAAALSHPHLIRLLEAGRCKLGGHPFLFVVTEYAEQNLAQILPHRALSPSEAQEMLTPTLDALAYLHRQNLVHGQLKASNFLVVNDQLKLASDTIRAAGDTTGIDLAGDVRALGATIVEALTQTRPALNAPANALSLPATLSAGLADALRRSLTQEPGNRPSVSELRKLVGPAAEVPPPPAPAPQVATPLHMPGPEMSAQPAATRASYERWLVPVVAVGLVLLAVWAGSRMLRSHAEPRPRATAVPIASQQTPSPAAAQSAATTQSQSTPVVHEEIPTISRGARDSIHGQIKVAVRVTVDHAGNVVAENLETHGSSRYFSRLASDAARKWKFAPVDNPSPREWSVQFEFSRNGATGLAVPRLR